MSKPSKKKTARRKNRSAKNKSRNRADAAYRDRTNYYELEKISILTKHSSDKLQDLWRGCQNIIAKYAGSPFSERIRRPKLGPETLVTEKMNAQIGKYGDDDIKLALFSEDLFVIADSMTCVYHSVGIHLGGGPRSNYEAMAASFEKESQKEHPFSATPALEPAMRILAHSYSERKVHTNDRTLPEDDIVKFMVNIDGNLQPHVDRLNRTVGLVRMLVAGHELSHDLLGHLDEGNPEDDECAMNANEIVKGILEDFYRMDLAKNREVHCDVLSLWLLWKTFSTISGDRQRREKAFEELYFASSILMMTLAVIAGRRDGPENVDVASHPSSDDRLFAMKWALGKLCSIETEKNNRRRMVDGLAEITWKNIIRVSSDPNGGILSISS